MIGRDVLDEHAEPQLDARRLQDLGGIGVGLFREGSEHRLAVIDDEDPGDPLLHLRILARHRIMDQVGERPGGFDAGGAGADDHEVEAPLLDPARVAVGLLVNLENPRARSRSALTSV